MTTNSRLIALSKEIAEKCRPTERMGRGSTPEERELVGAYFLGKISQNQFRSACTKKEGSYFSLVQRVFRDLAMGGQIKNEFFTVEKT
jgi:hypothetical protein